MARSRTATARARTEAPARAPRRVERRPVNPQLFFDIAAITLGALAVVVALALVKEHLAGPLGHRVRERSLQAAALARRESAAPAPAPPPGPVRSSRRRRGVFLEVPPGEEEAGPAPAAPARSRAPEALPPAREVSEELETQ